MEDLVTPGDLREKVVEEVEKLKSRLPEGKGGARPLFKDFKEYNYEPEKCKDCDKLKFAKREGIDYRLTGYRIESPVGLFVLEGCNLKTVCPYKRRIFVVKCLSFNYHRIVRLTEELEDRLLGFYYDEESDFWSQFREEEEGFEKAKEILKTFFLFGKPELAEKVLESYPFPEHFNYIFEAFLKYNFGGILAYPYMSYVECALQHDLHRDDIGKKKHITGEEFLDLFFAAPYENYDLIYLEAIGEKRVYKTCACIAKKCCAYSIYNTLSRQMEYMGVEAFKALSYADLLNYFATWNYMHRWYEQIIFDAKTTSDEVDKFISQLHKFLNE